MKKLLSILFGTLLLISSVFAQSGAQNVVTASSWEKPTKEVIDINGLSSVIVIMGTSGERLKPISVGNSLYGLTDNRCSQQITWLKTNAKRQGSDWVVKGDRYNFDSTNCQIIKEAKIYVPHPCGNSVHWVDQLSNDALKYYNLTNSLNMRFKTPLKQNICFDKQNVKVVVDATLPVA